MSKWSIIISTNVKFFFLSFKKQKKLKQKCKHTGNDNCSSLLTSIEFCANYQGEIFIICDFHQFPLTEGNFFLQCWLFLTGFLYLKKMIFFFSFSFFAFLHFSWVSFSFFFFPSFLYRKLLSSFLFFFFAPSFLDSLFIFLSFPIFFFSPFFTFSCLFFSVSLPFSPSWLFPFLFSKKVKLTLNCVLI